MNIPNDLKYTKDHEWVKLEGNKAWVGITDYAQAQLGDVVFVECTAMGEKIAAGATIASIESVKAVSDIYAPLSGTVVEVNTELESAPELVNEDPYKAWISVIEVANDVDYKELMSAEEYSAMITVD